MYIYIYAYMYIHIHYRLWWNRLFPPSRLGVPADSLGIGAGLRLVAEEVVALASQRSGASWDFWPTRGISLHFMALNQWNCGCYGISRDFMGEFHHQVIQSWIDSAGLVQGESCRKVVRSTSKNDQKWRFRADFPSHSGQTMDVD